MTEAEALLIYTKIVGAVYVAGARRLSVVWFRGGIVMSWAVVDADNRKQGAVAPLFFSGRGGQ